MRSIKENLHSRTVLIAFACSIFAAGPAYADSPETGGKLLLTRGVTSVDGTGGGGIVPWALITGNETERGIGASAFITAAHLPDYTLTTFGGAAGFYDRLELSYAHQTFDTGDTGALLGIGEGYEFGQDIFGAKLRIAGDAVYDQDRWMPQVAIGALYKSADDEPLLQALGADSANGTEFYVSATKLILEHSLLLNGTLRYSDANQNGLLGFGGMDDAGLYPEFSVGYLLSRRLVVGGEYRAKPDALGFAREDDWFDLYAVYALNDTVSLTAAWADLGSIATFDNQRGLYVSLQLGF